MFAFRFVTIGLFWLSCGKFDPENSRSRSWPMSNPMHIFRAYNSIDMFEFCFVAIGTFLAEIRQNPYLTLKIQGQGHNENRPKYNQVIYRSSYQMKKIRKIVQKLSREQKSAAGGGACAAAYEPVQKHSRPVYRDDFIILQLASPPVSCSWKMRSHTCPMTT